MLNKAIRNEALYNAAMATLLFVGLFLLFGRREWWPEFYSPYFFGAVFVISAFIILASKIIFHSTDECRASSGNFLRFVIMIALVINTAGELYFYQLYRFGFQFDKFAHLSNSLLFVIALATFGQTWLSYGHARALKLSIVIVFISGLGWELAEFLSDKLFRTTEFGIYGQLKFIDTVLDIIYNLLGITLAAIIRKSSSLRLTWEVQTCQRDPDVLTASGEAISQDEKSPF